MIDLGLLVIRVALGATIAAHGAQKLFGWWGGGGLAGTGRMFGSLGFRPARVTAVLGGLAEFGGGLLVAFGLLTPVGCLAVISMMIGAIASVHLSKGWWNTAGGSEFPALVAAIAFGLTLTGPGEDSLDAALGWSTGGGWWAVGVLAVSALVAMVIIALLREGRMSAATADHPAPVAPSERSARP